LPHPVAIAVVTLIASLGHKHAGLMNLLNLFVEINKQKLILQKVTSYFKFENCAIPNVIFQAK
jgi:hypothetical protein